jgi:amidase
MTPTAAWRGGERVGPLHGLPIAFKDLEAAVGFPWTMGSPIYKDQMPMEDSVLIERLRGAGVIPIGKTAQIRLKGRSSFIWEIVPSS